MTLRILIFLMICGVALGAQEKQEKKDDGKSGTAAKQAAAPLSIPPGAKRIEQGTYEYTDAKGKKWIYRRTPFGVVRIEDKPEEKPAAQSAPDLKAVEDGDSIRFERQTPFGPVKWVRKKTELTEEEQAAWDRTRRKPAETGSKK
jgi:hypothetical protein